MDSLGNLAASAYLLFEHIFLTAVSGTEFWVTCGFASFVLLISLHFRGYRFSWPRAKVESVLANMAFWAGNLLFLPAVILLTDPVKAAYDALGIPSINESFWADVPVWILVPFAAFCYDFADYWNHRAMHHRWLWPIHAIHHSDPDMNVLTSYRVHFLEVVVMSLSYVFLLSWLGFPTDVMGFGAIFLLLHNMYVHLNIGWHHGPFKYVLASPRLHQWHHADLPAAYGKNLANVFPVFDLVFGTYYEPGPCKEPLGAKGVPKNDVIKLMLFPFAEWGRQALRPLRKLRWVKVSKGTEPQPE